MNDDFNKLRPDDDEPEQPDDSLDWLNDLEGNPSDLSSQDAGSEDLPPAQADDPLAWLQEYVAPGDEPMVTDAPPPSHVERCD